MSRFFLRAVLSLCLFGAAIAQGPGAKCTGSTETFPSTGGPFNLPFSVGLGMVVTEQTFPAQDPATTGRDFVALSVQIAKSCTKIAHPGSANVRIGLYELTPGTTQLVRRTTTGNYLLTEAQVISGVSNLQLPVLDSALYPQDGGSFYIGFATDNSNVCLEGSKGFGSFEDTGLPTYNPDSTLPATLTANPQHLNPQYEASSTVCLTGNIVADPVFTGFHGQQFVVKGEAGKVFNLISSSNLAFNNRFVALGDNESMTAAAMKEVRAQLKTSSTSKMVELIKPDSINRPPVTTAWNHPGTYMGESGVTLGESQLYVAPGAYATGFSAITLDGVTLPISSKPVELDGDMTVTRPSAFKVVISTPSVRFSIVNSDHFVNIEHARVQTADAQLTGLLGQTADAEWEVVQSAEFTQHVENDYIVSSNELF